MLSVSEMVEIRPSSLPGAPDEKGDTVGITFPGESPEYRAARERLLEQEIELRRATEAVAAARRALPPGGVAPEDYVFQGAGADGTTTDVRLSELFASGKESLVIYSFMFPRDPGDKRPGPASGQTALLKLEEGTSSSRRLRSRESSPSPRRGAGEGCGSCPRPATPTTATTSPRPTREHKGRC